MTDTPSAATLPDTGRGRVAAFRPGTVALALAGVMALLALGFDRWDARLATEFARGEAVGRLSPRRVALQNRIAHGFADLPGLSALLSVHWGDPDLPEQFGQFADRLRLGDSSPVRSLQYLQDGVITRAWPSAGNEQAIGRNLLEDTRAMTREDYLRAVRTAAPTVTLSGPLPLYQGGLGLIGRLRVELPDPATVVLVAAVLDLPALIRASGLTDTTGVRWLLRDGDGRRIAGEPDSVMQAADPVTLDVVLADRTWRLEGAPRAGWAAMTGGRTTRRRAALLGVVSLAGLFGFLLQSRLRTQLETEYLRELRDAEAQFALLFQLVPDGVALIRTDDDRYVQVNDAYCEVTGRERNDLVGRPVPTVGVWAAPEDRDRAVLEVRATGALIDFPFVIRRPDGSDRETLVSCRVIDLEGEPHYLSVVRDVHERVALERRLVASQRLEAIGRLAGGVAHDFNNLITAIGGYSGLALSDLPEGDPRRDDILEIQRASGRAAELTRQLLTFARRQVVLPRRVDLDQLVAGMAPLLRRLAGDATTVALRRSDGPVPVLVDPSQLEHAFVNLVVNARDAMPNGGTVTVQVGFRDGLPILEVHDTGNGIPAAARPHLFEPFYTTKAPGRGTGLGLATVYGIVEQAGGSIEVESEVGKGSTFRIVLPAAGLEPVEDPSILRRDLPRGTEHVLIVDDEPQVRDICARVLARLGYTVTTASEGGEALRRLAEPTQVPYALVLTDLVMPGMGGMELLRILSEGQVAVRIVLMSGYSEEVMSIGVGEVPFLPKPFTAEELALVVREALDGASSAG